MSSSVKFAVFDCDGTLVDSQHSIGAGMDYAWLQEGITAPSRLDIKRQVGLPLVEAIANLLPNGNPAQYQRMAESYRDSFNKAAINLVNEEPLFPGCIEILDQLRAEDVILGVATGKGHQGLRSTIKRHGLDGYFEVLKTADDGPGKPNPRILLDAMIEVGASPENTIMIGDTTFDITTAVNAEVASLGVSWGYHETEELLNAGAAMVIDFYHELPTALAKIWEGR